MRRITATLGALAAAATIALAVPDSALAATGNLVINGVGHINPSGCYATGSFISVIANQTDSIAVVYSGSGCTGDTQAIIQPGVTTLDFGSSVYIP